MVTQLTREVKVDLLAVFLHLAEQAAAAAGADTYAADLHVARLFALWNRDRETLWVAEAEANAVDDCGQGDRLVEANNAAHASAGMTVNFGGGDGVAFVGTTAQSQCGVVEG